ncbi:MAG TPA: hypothetical protein VFL65_00745 [Jatrophihabitans sp.]|nr:hypothetical protein [Jatrophihabitans sp.]
MPIKPENRARYPEDWPAIRAAILDRAGNRCECDGRCESPHCYGVGHVRCQALHGEPHPSTGSRVVLTVAHLDHTPENCDPANLRAMCQACHLAYDRELHAANRAATIAARKETRGRELPRPAQPGAA